MPASYIFKTRRKPTFSRVMIKGIPYYRTRIKDADGKRVSLYAKTEKELAVKLAMARGVIEDAKFRKYNPTVAEYTEKWLVMQSAHIQPMTLDGYLNFFRIFSAK